MGKLKAKEVQRVPDDCITVALGLSEVRVIGERETATEITVEKLPAALIPLPDNLTIDSSQAALYNGLVPGYANRASPW